ncbi:MAG TPA: hypothetical protein VJS64_01175, partial [Pyrinomonadaceae bacterium]|nr:hypothetical protein [Pyrinomonadaceae bacterium]
MPGLQFRLFGKFTAHHDSGLLRRLEASKDQELLSYLLIHRGRSHSREALATLLWGETSTEKSKKYLRQALWHIQSALDTGASANNQVLLVGHDWVQLNLQSDFWVDLAVFEQGFASASGVSGKDLDPPKAKMLKEAVRL